MSDQKEQLRQFAEAYERQHSASAAEQPSQPQPQVQSQPQSQPQPEKESLAPAAEWDEWINQTLSQAPAAPAAPPVEVQAPAEPEEEAAAEEDWFPLDADKLFEGIDEDEFYSNAPEVLKRVIHNYHEHQKRVLTDAFRQIAAALEATINPLVADRATNWFYERYPHLAQHREVVEEISKVVVQDPRWLSLSFEQRAEILAKAAERRLQTSKEVLPGVVRGTPRTSPVQEDPTKNKVRETFEQLLRR